MESGFMYNLVSTILSNMLSDLKVKSTVEPSIFNLSICESRKPLTKAFRQSETQKCAKDLKKVLTGRKREREKKFWLSVKWQLSQICRIPNHVAPLAHRSQMLLLRIPFSMSFIPLQVQSMFICFTLLPLNSFFTYI